MSANKDTVLEFIAGFSDSDHARVLACLTDDVEWVIPGFTHARGKEAFDKEIENPAFEGKPKIDVTRMTEERNVVVAEGMVQTKPKGGAIVNVAFCDVFEMRDARIKRLTSYLVPISGDGNPL